MIAEVLPKRKMLLAFAGAMIFNVVVLAYFHNRFWWPPDEGAYAHTAERILKGDKLNSDVEEIHTGYLNFLHAGVFAVAGVRLVSLRYPLVVVALLQSCLAFLLFSKRNLWAAVIVSISSISMGVIQYLNPQPSWYCLLLVTIIAYCLIRIQSKHRVVFVGCLVGLVILLRQVTGVFVAMGVLTYLLTEKTEQSENGRFLVSRGLLLLMIVGTAGYLASATDAFGLLLFGIWPIVILILAMASTKSSDKETLAILIKLAIGGLAAATPILIYHCAHRSLFTFFDDTIIRALHVSRFSYLKESSYSTFQLYGLTKVLEFGSFATVINGIYWIVLPFTAAILGFATLARFRQSRLSASVGAVPILAVFYGLVALLQQIPIYLYYILPLTIAGLFWLSVLKQKQLWILSTIAIVFSAVSLYYHAAQPITRRGDGTVRGDRIALVEAKDLDRTGLWIDPESMGIYRELVQTIKEQSQPDQTIFVLPNDPELYFLADRKNPFRFWNSAIGMRDPTETDEVLEVLKSHPPSIIVFAPNDRNNTQNSQRVIEYVRHNYSLVKTISNFEVYRSLTG